MPGTRRHHPGRGRAGPGGTARLRGAARGGQPHPPAGCARRDRPGGHLLHRRHDGQAEGGDAVAAQPGGQRLPHDHGSWLPRRRRLPPRRADVPPGRRRVRLRDHLRRRHPRPHSGLPAAGRAGDDRAGPRDQRRAGADHDHGAAQPPRHRPTRPRQPAPTRLRGLADRHRHAPPGDGAAPLPVLPGLWHDRSRAYPDGPAPGGPPSGRVAARPATPRLGGASVDRHRAARRG